MCVRVKARTKLRVQVGVGVEDEAEGAGGCGCGLRWRVACPSFRCVLSLLLMLRFQHGDLEFATNALVKPLFIQ